MYVSRGAGRCLGAILSLGVLSLLVSGARGRCLRRIEGAGVSCRLIIIVAMKVYLSSLPKLLRAAERPTSAKIEFPLCNWQVVVTFTHPFFLHISPLNIN